MAMYASIALVMFSVKQTLILKGVDEIWSLSGKIGSGATANVYKCLQRSTGKPFAAKVANAEHVRERESKVLRALTHPNIVKFVALEKELHSKMFILIMEYCKRSLKEVEPTISVFGI